MWLDVSGHEDTFARDHILRIQNWPDLVYTMPELRYPTRMNAATALLDDGIAERGGGRPAMVTESETWTYADLADRANQIANLLVADLGLISGNRVVLRGYKTPWYVACFLALAKSGMVTVPVAPTATTRELAAIRDIVQPSVALCEARAADALFDLGLRVAVFGSGDAADITRRARRHSTRFLACDVAADDVVLIQFTSGTTGAPKGAMHFHRDVVASADLCGGHLWRMAPGQLVASDRALTGYAFGGLAVLPLRRGAASLMVEHEDPAAFFDAIRHHDVDIVFSSPVTYRTMLEQPTPIALGRARTYVSSGEILTSATAVAWEERTGSPLCNPLGTTELFWQVCGARNSMVRPGTVGQAVPGYELRIVDDSGQVCPTGAAGALAVRGPTGCKYLDSPLQRTAVRDGWTLTGDRAHIDHEGYVWLHGRMDDLVNVNGNLVAPAEIEEVISTSPAAAEAVVVGATAPGEVQTVVAFVVLREGASAEAAVADIMGLAARSLAGYKLPAHLIRLDVMPRRANGKVDRAELRRRAHRVVHDTE